MRLIDADALFKNNCIIVHGEDGECVAQQMINILRTAPTIEAEPVKNGRWQLIYKCENCKNKDNCVENKAEYTALSKVVEAVLNLTKQDEFRSWFTLEMRCDYFVSNEKQELATCDR